MLNTSDIELATDKKYTEFSNAIKQELANKMASNPIIKKAESEFDRITKMKNIFNQINSLADKDNNIGEPE